MLSPTGSEKDVSLNAVNPVEEAGAALPNEKDEVFKRGVDGEDYRTVNLLSAFFLMFKGECIAQ